MVSVGAEPGNLQCRLTEPMPSDSLQPPLSVPTDSGPATPRHVYVPARAVGAYLPKLTRKAFETFGFSTATLLTEWATIVGDPLSRYALPEKIKWPRAPAGEGDNERNTHARCGATLVLRVDPARALDVEYKAQQILERINAYFGYRAVAELRLLQAPLTATGAAPGPQRALPACEAPELSGIADERLRGALQRLKQGLMSRAR
jgi:hypothetical protein